MCGIAGSINLRSMNSADIKKCHDILARRGPDYQGFYDSNNGCQLLHTRLAILDLDNRSNQPFEYQHLVVVFNGEIYNYVELRKTLQHKGFKFTTQGDTEVLAAAWMHWGEDAVHHLDGMWAFTVYDQIERILYLCTDPFGEKPLYFCETDKSNIAFSSKIEVLPIIMGETLDLDLCQLSNYLVNGYKSLNTSNRTFFKNVKRLEGGSLLRVSESGKKLKSYFTPNFRPLPILDDAEAVEAIRHELLKAISIRLRSDVPLAFCLSGGVDSNVLIGAAVKEFNISATGFTITNADGRYDEANQVSKTANYLGIKSEKISMENEDFIENLRFLVGDRMSPVSTISYYTQNILYKKMANSGFKVAISGTGADELFTGYYDHHLLHLANEFETDKDKENAISAWQKHIKPIIRNPLLQEQNLYLDAPQFREHIYYKSDVYSKLMIRDMSEHFTEKDYPVPLLRKRMLNELFHEAVPVILFEDDANAMYHSIENRSPFLSKGLFELTLSLPVNRMIRDGFAKYYLRKAGEGYVHPEVLWTKKKIGFNSSLFELLDIEKSDTREFLLDRSKIFEVIDRQKFEEYLKGISKQNSDSKFLFNFLNAKIFYEQIS